MHTPLRRSLTGLVTAALAGSLVAFAPAPAPAAVASSAPEVDAVRTADGSWVRTVDGMADRFGFAPGDDLRDPLTWFERHRRISAANGLETFSAIDGECVDGCDGEEPVDLVDEAWSYSSPVADLDGDGTDEVLVMEVVFGEEAVTSTTTARSGEDGTVLWTSTDSGLAFVGSVPDLDGDGLTDLVGGSWMLMFAMFGECTDPLGIQCTSGEVVDEVYDITAFRGQDATEIGSYTVEGSYRFEYEDTTVGTPTGWLGSGEFRVTVDNGFFGVGIIDLDGDGTFQLVHETFDATFTQRAGGTMNDTPLGWADAVLIDTSEDLAGSIELVDLAAGSSEPIIAVEDALAIGSAVPGPVGDQLLVDLLPEYGTVRGSCLFVDPVVGDCSDDLPGSAPNDAVPTRTLYDADLAEVWTVTVPETSFFVYGAGADLDGDGVPDLFDIGFDEETWEDTVSAVSGATGETIWTVAASVLASDGTRLVGARVSFWDALAVDGLVVDPATGRAVQERRLVEQSFEEPDGGGDTITFGSLGVWVTTVTAGSQDVVVDARLSTYTVEEYCETWEEPDGTTYEECWGEPGELVSSDADTVGAEGTDLTELFHFEDPSLALADVAEYDGDAAAAELVVMVVDPADWWGFGQTIRAIGLDGTTLWEASLPLYAVGPVRNVDGTNDVLVEDWEAGTIGVRDGRDFTPRWTIAG